MTNSFSNPSNQEVFEQWQELKTREIKASSLPQYRSGAFAVEEAIADKDISEITPEDIQNAYEARTKKQSHTAVFLTDCFAWGLIDLSTDTLRFLLNKSNR